MNNQTSKYVYIVAIILGAFYFIFGAPFSSNLTSVTNNERLIQNEEYIGDYNRKEWGSWRSNVDRDLRWKKSDCKWAFYDSSPKNCLSNVDRDHLVSLHEAYKSGGHAWTNEQKRNYYNDTDNLWVMNSSANRSKSDLDPKKWKPNSKTAWCDYANKWIDVKEKYNLTSDRDEYKQLVIMLEECEKDSNNSVDIKV